jgi:hypothetical protein
MKNNGYYSDDPQVAILGEYQDFGGQMVWFILYHNETDRLEQYRVLPKFKVLREFS